MYIMSSTHACMCIYIHIYVCIYTFITVLAVEPRVLGMKGQHSTPELYSQPNIYSSSVLGTLGLLSSSSL